MAVVRKRVRLANPTRRRRKMSPKQIRFFGTKRQRAALKSKRRRTTTKRAAPKRVARKRVARRRVAMAPRRKTHRRRTSNVGEIITIGLQPGTKKRSKSMATRRRKRRVARNPVRRYRRRRVMRARARNPVRRIRRRRVTRRISRRRRNPAARQLLTGTMRNVVGVVGGAAAVKLIVDRLPYNLNAGPIGYLSTGIVAAVLGMAVGRFGKNRPLGEMVALGGFVYLTLRVLQDFIPGLAAISPIGLRGVVPSSFYNPQVQRAGSLTNFVTPSAVSSAVSLQGVGMNRRFARVR